MTEEKSANGSADMEIATKESTNGSVDVELTKEATVTDVENKEENAKVNDKEEKKESTPLFVPTIDEFSKDLGYYYDPRTLIIGPVKFSELNQGKLSIVTQKAEYCEVKLSKNEDCVLQGYLELVFENEDQAVSCFNELESCASTGVIVKHMKHVDNQTVDIEDIINKSLGYKSKIENTVATAERVIVVPQLSPDVTSSDIKEKIKDARTILFPVSHITNDKKSYAYVEVPSFKSLKHHNNWSLKFGRNRITCKKLGRIPKVDEVIRDLKKSFNFTPEEVEALIRNGTHYQRSEWIDEKTKESLKTHLETTRNILKKRTNRKNFQSNSSNDNPIQSSNNFDQLTALSSNSFSNKKQKMGRNQRS